MRCLRGFTGSVALMLGLMITSPTHASTLSPQLLEWLRNGYHLDEEIKIVVQLTEALGEQERADLFSRGHEIVEFEQLQMIALTIPARELPRWSANPRVQAIDLDREVHALAPAASLIQRATGADIARNTYALTGNGIGIAVLDSGLTGGIVDFKNEMRYTFVPGESSEDRYGHGTHVTGIISGDGSNSISKLDKNYQGLATGASTHNLKVLSNLGTGQVSWVLSAIDWVLANRASKCAASVET